LTLESTLAEVLADPVAASLAAEAFAAMMPGEDLEGTDAMGVDILSLIGSAPVGRMVSISSGLVTREQLEQLLAKANAESER
jgi:beta-glucosidase